jgi:pilus assembly protein Flp/PilA
MLALWNYLSNLKYILTHDEEGQGMVEYALIIALIAILIIGALVLMRGGLENIFGDVTNTLNDPASATGS